MAVEKQVYATSERAFLEGNYITLSKSDTRGVMVKEFEGGVAKGVAVRNDAVKLGKYKFVKTESEAKAIAKEKRGTPAKPKGK